MVYRLRMQMINCYNKLFKLKLALWGNIRWTLTTVGILNLPKTTARASLIVSLILMTLVVFLGFLLARYAVDAVSRTFALKRYDFIKAGSEIQIGDDPLQQEVIVEQAEPEFQLSNTETYEFTEMCQIHFGKGGFIFFLISTVLIIFGAIWGYTAIVAQSLASIIPFGKNWSCNDPCGVYSSQCNIAYYVWTYVAVIYASIFIFFDLAKQKVIQVFLTIVRLSTIFIVAVVPLICMFISPFNIGNLSSDSVPYIKQDINIFKLEINSFSSIFASSIYAVIVHLSIPAAIKPVEPNQQKYINKSITGAFAVVYILMILVAFPSAMYFGTDGAQLITLNFLSWDGKSWNSTNQPIFYIIFSYVVRVMPPIYVLGAMPIIALSMSNNLVLMAPKLKDNIYFIAFTKLFSVIPAGVLAGFFRCLGQIIDLTGLFGFIIVLSPGIILLKAKKSCKMVFGVDKSLYSGFLDQAWVIWTIVGIFAVGFCFTFYGVVAGFVQG